MPQVGLDGPWSQYSPSVNDKAINNHQRDWFSDLLLSRVATEMVKVISADFGIFVEKTVSAQTLLIISMVGKEKTRLMPESIRKQSLPKKGPRKSMSSKREFKVRFPCVTLYQSRRQVFIL
jgi:hypothetical protein